ncbi:hypothetical protein E0485_15245 [Paenibacillus albiflavus]|uniref:Uncharacterized protein n=1 Tax=Paenibacillus albiflavus TaxID=2545760 RepID=A0A4R4EB79_9BACL
MEIIIRKSTIQFKNPQVGQPTRAVGEHYNGRTINASVDGNEKLFRFKKEEIPFLVDEDEMITTITARVNSELE